jgi:hypothetical protein
MEGQWLEITKFNERVVQGAQEGFNGMGTYCRRWQGITTLWVVEVADLLLGRAL